MGLLPGEADSDAKYNVNTEEKSKNRKKNTDPKDWIKTALTKKSKKSDATENSSEDEKIDTNGLLKKEDKNDL